MKNILKLLWLVPFCLLAIGLASCGGNTTDEVQTQMNNTYVQISAAEAKALMDSEKDYVIIDARTQEEYDAGHIPGAVLIPEYEIADRAESKLPDKNQLILVYCRSGRRSKIASQALVDLGYTNVKEFGGIIDWEYETVK
ncbi:MAG: rhodanese-like domain-containing protein [Clostridia bacterium]|nr:rhodanese-like domain-containing protein [Clostridia bacterium]